MTTTTTSATSTATRRKPIIEVERATDEDAGEIARVLWHNADVPTLILQPPATILRHIDEFVVVRGPDRMVVGCAQLHWHRPQIAEVMDVAVDPARRGEGLGRVLVRACLERSMQHDPAPSLVWLATKRPGFFAALGFRRIPVWRVPPMVLLGKLGLVLEQPPRRWLGTLSSHAVIMRWTGAW
jgi:amino-acid N-acetyltransferase